MCIRDSLRIMDEYCVGSATLDSKTGTSNQQQRVRSHDDSISALLYAEEFSVCITGSHDSMVRVWNAVTGEMQFHFSKAHGEGSGASITAMCLDAGGRRLITGAHNGSVKVWNYSSGECLKECIMTRKAEVTALLYASDETALENGYIVATGWNHEAILWDDGVEGALIKPALSLIHISEPTRPY
eukprot:TRINITY_DN7793_c0_g4_i1.p1 TRINITY_DN7793_c0_g4~~TRINITY_DN7793_c0_g4_i1.p1  ORF type:complete len:185 (+),score=50.10 TRINITY_DN7793_c0_g4_i1:65-619(+)